MKSLVIQGDAVPILVLSRHACVPSQVAFIRKHVVVRKEIGAMPFVPMKMWKVNSFFRALRPRGGVTWFLCMLVWLLALSGCRLQSGRCYLMDVRRVSGEIVAYVGRLHARASNYQSKPNFNASSYCCLLLWDEQRDPVLRTTIDGICLRFLTFFHILMPLGAKYVDISCVLCSWHATFYNVVAITHDFT